jgi:hypothetical protein
LTGRKGSSCDDESASNSLLLSWDPSDAIRGKLDIDSTWSLATENDQHASFTNLARSPCQPEFEEASVLAGGQTTVIPVIPVCKITLSPPPDHSSPAGSQVSDIGDDLPATPSCQDISEASSAGNSDDETGL